MESMEENPYKAPRTLPDDAEPGEPLTPLALFRWIGYFALLVLGSLVVVWLFSVLASVLFR